MTLIDIKYLEESSKAIFFTITFEKTNFFGIKKVFKKEAYLQKWSGGPELKHFGRYANNFKFVDNSGGSNYDEPIIELMILLYEKNIKNI